MADADPSSSEQPRLVIDEDWKAQVEREKSAQRENSQPGDSANELPTSDDLHLPPANFSGIVSMLASQAMAAMGLLPDPYTGEAAANRTLAKFLIDTLGVLEQKTEGNRTASESRELQDALHHLRMIYVATPVAPPVTNRKSASAIELP